MNQLRKFFESIVFAGMKPGGQTAPKTQLRWLGPLRGPVERLISGPAISDPLYLTNRTFLQKLRSWSLIAIPCLILAGAVAVALSVLDPPAPPPAKEPTAAEITAKLLPNMDKDIKLAPASDVQVLEVRVEGTQLVGSVKNTTEHPIASVELIVDLTTAGGSQVGAVSAFVDKLPPSGRKNFQIPIKQRNAAFALVREIIAH